MTKRLTIDRHNWKDWLQVKSSSIPSAGRGVFACNDMPRGTVLGNYHGRSITTLKEVYSLKNDEFVFCIRQPDRRPLWIDGNVPSNYLRFVNGARTGAEQPLVNLEAYQYAGTLRFRTTRRVAAGEELILDYGDDYWNTYSNADGIKHRNKRLLAQLTTEIENTADARLSAALRGMRWLIEQMASPSAYYAFFPGYLWMFYEFLLSKGHPVIVEISTTLLELELDGAQFRLDKMFNANIDGKWRFISLLPILFEVDADRTEYANVYRSLFPRSLQYYDISFYDCMANDDFEGMVDVLMDYCFLQMARNSSRDSRLFRLPDSRFSNYWQVIKQTDIAALEAGVTSEFEQLQLDYQITHLVMCRVGYGSRVLVPASKLDNQIRDYMKRHEDRVLASTEDLDLIAEYAYCYLIMKTRDTWVAKAINTLVAAQHADGSWGTEQELRADVYSRCHPTWTAVTALCYSLRS